MALLGIILLLGCTSLSKTVRESLRPQVTPARVAPGDVSRPTLASHIFDYEADFEAVTNSDIKWADSADGLYPVPNAFAEQFLSKMEAESRSGHRDEVLFAAKRYLTDPQRFVVAHIVLTYVSGVEFSADAKSWNYMRFKADGGPVHTPMMNQIEALTRMWSAMN